MSVTPIYGGLAALMFALLTFRVIQLRGVTKIGLGFEDNRGLQRAIRVHGNFAEYVPFVLLLMAFAEFQNVPIWRVHLIGILLMAGRVIHIVGVLRDPEPPRLRVAGIALTLTAVINAALANLVGAL